jgi:hypothetical protein
MGEDKIMSFGLVAQKAGLMSDVASELALGELDASTTTP